MRTYPVPEGLQTELGAAAIGSDLVRRFATTASGSAGEWARRIVDSEEAATMAVLAGCGCDEAQDYYGILDPDYDEPLVVAVVTIDPEDQLLRRWNGSGWDTVPVEYEPEGYPFVGLEGDMLADALRASGGMLLRPLSPKAKVRGPVVAAGEAATSSGKHFAIVDEFDNSAVLDLLEVRPGPNDVSVLVRRDGQWEPDSSYLGAMRSVDPPRYVAVSDEDLEAVMAQVDEYDRAHPNADDSDDEPGETDGDEGITAAFSMREDGGGGTRAPARKKPAKSGSSLGDSFGSIGKSVSRMAKTTRKTGRKTGAAARSRGLHSNSSGGRWEEEKYNRVDGKFAPKGAADDHSNDGGRKRKGTGTGRRSGSGTGKGRAVGSKARGAGKKTTAAQKARVAKKLANKKALAAKLKAKSLQDAAMKAEKVMEAKWEIGRKKADLAEAKRRGSFNDKMAEFYGSYNPSDPAQSSRLDDFYKEVQAEQARRTAYDRAAEYEAQAEDIRRLERRLKLGLVASVGDRALIASPPAHTMMPDKLKNYWARGKGAAKIRWGTGGDFNRCRRALSKYLNPAQVPGACANLHKIATGTWPGKGRGHAASAMLAAGYGGNGAMVSFRIDPDTASRLAANVDEGNPVDEIHVTLAYLGEDVPDSALWATAQVVSGIVLEYNAFRARLGGRGQFINEDEVANYVSVDAPGIEGFWVDLTDRLHRAGVPLPSEHGFTPHITLKYGVMTEPEWPALPLAARLGTIEVRSAREVLGSWELLP